MSETIVMSQVSEIKDAIDVLMEDLKKNKDSIISSDFKTAAAHIENYRKQIIPIRDKLDFRLQEIYTVENSLSDALEIYSSIIEEVEKRLAKLNTQTKKESEKVSEKVEKVVEKTAKKSASRAAG